MKNRKYKKKTINFRLDYFSIWIFFVLNFYFILLCYYYFFSFKLRAYDFMTEARSKNNIRSIWRSAVNWL